MNSKRRKKLAEIIEKLEVAKEMIEYVRDEEQESFDNLPEGIQCSEKGETMENNIDEMEESIDLIDEALEKLQNL